MDASIRKLIAKAGSHPVGEKNPELQQAFKLLRGVAESRPVIDAPEAFGQDLYVLCAELALQHGLIEMAKECLKMFSMKQPAANQFLCRAYLCHAQLLAPKDSNDLEKLEKAMVYVTKAISFAKNNPRYHFLVYNSSVIYWQLSRPFLKPGYRQYLVHSLHQVVKALDEIEDNDFEWRAQLMISLTECHIDANRRSDAANVATAAASFIKTNVPTLYKKLFGLMVRYQLCDLTKIQKETKSSPELNAFYKICKLKNIIEQEEVVTDYATEIESILNLLDNKKSQVDPLKSDTLLSKTDSRKSDGKTPAQVKRFSSTISDKLVTLKI